MREASIRRLKTGQNHPLLVMCGPCAIESKEHLLLCAEVLKDIFVKENIALVFKSSYDKANRSSIHSPRGVGIDEGLRLLELVKSEFDLPVVTDVHSPEEAKAAGDVCDVLQIPAFLCRQTDLIIAAAETPAAVSVKKGQFMAPWDMQNVVEKIRHCGNSNIILIERGTCFGYNNLVSDMRAIPIMQQFDVPVCFDATHSVQLPGGLGATSGGQRQYVELLAKAAIASGADALFMEAHPDPDNAFSDRGSQIDFEQLRALLPKLKKMYELIRE
jgi:2-dehydro-3-deoxyphosphooctonate aldolase (KDO 8-P synthase)